MEKAAENSEYINTVNYYLGMVLATHAADEVTEGSFSQDNKAEINGFFVTLMDQSEWGELHSRSGTPFCFEIFKLELVNYVQEAFTKELEKQLQLARNERGSTA